MKKNILKFGIALAVVAAAGYITYSSQTEIQLSGVSIDNVEALASGESDLCPNGCMGPGDGCFCHYWFPNLAEH